MHQYQQKRDGEEDIYQVDRFLLSRCGKNGVKGGGRIGQGKVDIYTTLGELPSKFE